MALQQSTDKGLRELALFAGAGGGILGGKLIGWRTVCAVEIDAYARSVLMARQDDGCLESFPIWDDVRTFDGRPWRGRVDVVSGGFPCQDISSAGKGEGITGERSGLWKEMSRIICEVRPRYAFVENSPVLTSRGLGVVLGDLASMGYDARWGVLGNGHVGPDKVGDRLWIAATTQPSGWERFLYRDARKRHQKTGAREETINVDPCDWSSRLQALEKVVGEPAILGSRNGLANQVDRLGAIGNGQVPAVVRLAWNLLMQISS